MIKGVVFDLDHTLFDRYATITEISPFLYEKYKDCLAPGLQIEDVVVAQIYADREYNAFGFSKVCEYLNNSGFFRTPMNPQEYTDIILEAFTQAAVPYPFTYTVLEEIKKAGYKVGLISNGSHNVQYAKLKLLGIENYFDEIIICGDLNTKKPNIMPFEVMAKKLDITPHNLVYVGDHPVNDVDASRRAGYVPVWVKTYEWQFNDVPKCDYEIDTVADLFEVLNKLNLL